MDQFINVRSYGAGEIGHRSESFASDNLASLHTSRQNVITLKLLLYVGFSCFRAYNRAVLKQQMADKWADERKSLTAKVIFRICFIYQQFSLMQSTFINILSFRFGKA